jgi:hypothetical protein
MRGADTVSDHFYGGTKLDKKLREVRRIRKMI